MGVVQLVQHALYDPGELDLGLEGWYQWLRAVALVLVILVSNGKSYRHLGKVPFKNDVSERILNQENKVSFFFIFLFLVL